MERAVIYARVSSKDQETEGFSIPAQLKFLHEYALKKHYVIVKEFTDAETAKKSGRTQFNEMISFIEKNGISHLLVEKTDRLLRNMSDYVLIKRLISSSNVSVHLCKENAILGNQARSDEKLIFGIKAVMAENYIDNLSDEVKKGMSEKAAQGVYPSWAPYGYINARENGKKIIKINSDEAPFVKKMFELYATGAYSLLSLKKKMLNDGMIYRGGKTLHKSKIELILKNEFYTGIFYWNGKKYENASHDAIINKELFHQVQNVLVKPNKSKSRKDLFPYTNLIKCGICGCSISAQIQKDRYIYYHCSSYKGNCNQPYVRQEDIEAEFSQLLSNIQINADAQQLILNGLRESLKDKIAYHRHNTQLIERQIKILQNRVDQAYLDKLDGKISEEFWLTQSKKWLHEKEILSLELLNYQKADTSYLESSALIFELIKKAPGLLNHAKITQKRSLISLLLSKCTMKDGNLDIELKPVFQMIMNMGKIGNWCARQDLNLRPTD